MPFYDPRAVANFFLEKGRQERSEHDGLINHLKLQNLIFLAHGWHLALTDQELVEEEFYAGPRGPRLKSIWAAFVFFGNRPIPILAIKSKQTLDDTAYSYHLEDYQVEDPDRTQHILERVWDIYKTYPDLQLSNQSRQKGTPWKEAIEGVDPERLEGFDIVIDNESIRKYFLHLKKKNEAKHERSNEAEATAHIR